MNIDKFVMDFIENSRYNVHDGKFPESQKAKIEMVFDDCLSSIVKKYIKEFIPSFIICNTYNKYSTILPVRLSRNQHKYYLLYDCHLNEINRLLDAIYFSEEDSGHDIWKLSYELFAEDALIEKDAVLISYYGLNKVALGPFDIDDENQADLDFIEKIQMRYIIGHELGHWIFKMSGDKDAKNLFNISFDEGWSAFLENIRLLLSELYAEYEKTFQSEEYVEIVHEQSVLVNENSGIWEECFADAVAYAMTFAHVQNSYPDDLSQKILAGQALFLEMMNLQILAMQHMTVSEESFEAATSIRMGFLRNYMRLYFEGNEKAFDSMLENTVVRYEERITNLMLDCFSELEKRADNLYDALTDSDGFLDTSRMMGLSDIYQNSDLI